MQGIGAGEDNAENRALTMMPSRLSGDVTKANS